MGFVRFKTGKANIYQCFLYALSQLTCLYAKILWSKGNVVFYQGGNQLVVRVLKHHAHTRAHVVDQLLIGGV